MSESHSEIPEASRNKAENAGAGNTTTKPDYQKPPTLFGKWPWCAQLVLILSVIFCIVVLLVGLPLGSLMIVNNMSPDSLSPTMSFWGALFTAFISLTTLFIAATFAFTAFKVETGARWEVREAVEKEVKEIVRCRAEKFLENHGDRLITDVADEYLKEHGERLSKEVAGGYLKEHGERLSKEVAGGYLENNGHKLVIEAAGGYLKDNGPGPTKEATKAYIQEQGERITREVLEEYAKKRIGLTGWLRGFVKPKGASEGSSKDTQTGDKQASRDASTDAPGDGPNGTDSRR